MKWWNDQSIVDKRAISTSTIEWWRTIVSIFRDPAYNAWIGAPESISSTYCDVLLALLGHYEHLQRVIGLTWRDLAWKIFARCAAVRMFFLRLLLDKYRFCVVVLEDVRCWCVGGCRNVVLSLNHFSLTS